MKGTMKVSDPVDCGDRTIVPILRDITMESDRGVISVRDPIGLVVVEDNQVWFVSLAEEGTMSVIDELFGIPDR